MKNLERATHFRSKHDLTSYTSPVCHIVSVKEGLGREKMADESERGKETRSERERRERAVRATARGDRARNQQEVREEVRQEQESEDWSERGSQGVPATTDLESGKGSHQRGGADDSDAEPQGSEAELRGYRQEESEPEEVERDEEDFDLETFEEIIKTVKRELRKALLDGDDERVERLTLKLRRTKEALSELREEEPSGQRRGRREDSPRRSRPEHRGGEDRLRVRDVGSSHRRKVTLDLKVRELPVYDPEGDQWQFVEDLECVLTTRGYDDLDEFGWRALVLALKDSIHKRSQVLNLKNKGESWEEIRSEFIKANQPRILQEQAVRKLHKITQGSRSLQMYYDEFVELARRVYLGGHQRSRTWSLGDLDQYSGIFVMGLKEELQRKLGEITVFETSQGSMRVRTLQENFDVLKGFEAVSKQFVKSDIKKRGSERKERERSRNEERRGRRKCYICNSEDHVARYCPKKGSDASQEKKATSNQKAASKEKPAWKFRGVCYHCGEEGHRARDCPKKSTEQGRMNHIREVVMADFPTEAEMLVEDSKENDGNHELFLKEVVNAVRNKKDLVATIRNEILDDKLEETAVRAVIDGVIVANSDECADATVVVELEGCQQTALVDSGSPASFVDATLVEERGWHVMDPDGKRFSGAGGAMLDVKAEVTVKMTLGGRKRLVTLRVVEGSTLEYPILLGRDLFRAFALGVTGVALPTKPRDEELPEDLQQPTMEAVDEQGSSARALEDAEWKDEHRVEDRLRGPKLALLEPCKERNLALVATEACHHPEATYKLELTGGPAFRKQYPLPIEARVELMEKVQEWKTNGVVEDAPMKSPWNSPMLRVSQGAKNRWCLDARGTNEVSAEQSLPVPDIFDIWARLSGSKYFSAIDLRHAYWQLPLHTESRDATTFSVGQQRYRFKVCPFGLKGLVGHMQALMAEMFRDMPAVVIYLDDILVQTKALPDESTEDGLRRHTNDVIAVIERLTRWGLRVNWEKSHFFYKKIAYLGHLVSGESREIQPQKLKKIFDWPRPTTGKQVMAYLGLTNYLRDYCPLYAALAAPLDKLRTKKKIRAPDWNDECQQAFDGLKRALMSAPTLRHPQPGEQYVVTVDASLHGLGAVLSQEVEGVTRYIMFVSRALNAAQTRYSATKRELLACVFALQKLRYFLYGHKFVLRCDHRALSYLLTQERLPMAVQGWLDVLLQYDFTIEYYPGVLNTLADSLSRVYPPFVHDAAQEEVRSRGKELALKRQGESVEREMSESGGGSGAESNDEAPERTEETVAYFRTTTEIKKKTPSAAAKVPLRLEALMMQEDTQYAFRELRRFVRERLGKVLPEPGERQRILEEAHCLGHFGAESLVQSVLRKGLYWPTLRRDAERMVRRCGPCLRHNLRRTGFRPMKAVHARYPFEHVQMDLAEFPPSDKGHVFMLVLTDIATRFTVLRALADKKATTVARELWSIFCLLFFPKILQSDQGTEFKNEVVSSLCKLAGIDRRLVLAYSPRGDGVVESKVGVAKAIIKKKVQGLWSEWYKYVDEAQLAMNSKLAPATKSIPAELLFGRKLSSMVNHEEAASHPLSPRALQERWRVMREVVWPATAMNLKESQEAVKSKADQRRMVSDDPYPVHTRVMLLDKRRRSKYDQRYTGPYRIVEVSKRGAYRLMNAAGHLVKKWISHNLLKLIELPEKEGANLEAVAENHEARVETPPIEAAAVPENNTPEDNTAREDDDRNAPEEEQHLNSVEVDDKDESLQEPQPIAAEIPEAVRKSGRQRQPTLKAKEGHALGVIDDFLASATTTMRAKRRKNDRTTRRQAPTRSSLAEVDIYNVQAILDHKDQDGETFFLVRWEGYDATHDSWVNKNDFQSEEIIRTYYEKINTRTDV